MADKGMEIMLNGEIGALNDFFGSDNFRLKTVPTDCLYVKNMSVIYILSKKE